MENFFSPRSIALVGASRTPGKVGHTLWRHLQRWGGRAYPVNPKFAYPDLHSVPGPVDLAVIAVPAPAVPAAVQDCLVKKVKAVIVISAGFAEAGRLAVPLTPPPGLPFLGPNCFGVAHPAARLDLTFARAAPPPGNIGLISQSGALASYLFTWAREEGLGFSKFASLGNRLDLGENQFLEYLGQDPATKIIGLYLESFKDGTGWLRLASRISRKKPVIVLFGGQTPAGRQASLSHTASLSPPAAIVRAALRQSGCIQAKTMADFTNLLEVFSLAPALTDNDLAIITNAGGPAILAADTASALNLDVGRPIDVLGDGDAARFRAGIDQALGNRQKDAFLVIVTPQAGTDFLAICQALAARFKHLKKPLVVSLLGGRLSRAAESLLRRRRIPTIALPQEAGRSLAALLEFYRGRRHPVYPVRRPYQVKPSRRVPEGRLSWQAGESIAKKYGLPLVKTKLAASPVKPPDLGWPVVLKADPAASLHRTEDKGIYLGLNSAAAFRTAWKRLHQKFPIVLCQEQVKEGHELFISLLRKPGWPPLLTLGSGGVYTELYLDTETVFLPVNTRLAADTLSQTRIGRILAGYRGGPRLVKPAIKLILLCCRLFEDYSALSELEINPAIVSRTKLTVVDIKLTSGTLPEVPKLILPA